MNRIFWNLIHQKFGQDLRILKIESQIKKPAFSRFQSFTIKVVLYCLHKISFACKKSL